MFYALIISKDGQQFNDAACNLKLPVLIGAAHLVLIQKVNALVGLNKAVNHISADNHFAANFQDGDFSPADQLANSISANAGISGSLINRQTDSAVSCSLADRRFPRSILSGRTGL